MFIDAARTASPNRIFDRHAIAKSHSFCDRMSVECKIGRSGSGRIEGTSRERSVSLVPLSSRNRVGRPIPSLCGHITVALPAQCSWGFPGHCLCLGSPSLPCSVCSMLDVVTIVPSLSQAQCCLSAHRSVLPRPVSPPSAICLLLCVHPLIPASHCHSILWIWDKHRHVFLSHSDPVPLCILVPP
ncbi:hypothetical protein GDO86_003094 [Hymenochirus boettgeri]|uniref:Uncharacterized protein n=1 Tax=Hymenochirus boettgeri TaxID=247094 RepID=A0A8T2JZJ4_9PIPI|nr:hypothetical protein GDO86_003094 [Hymenochirus boettgeri]